MVEEEENTGVILLTKPLSLEGDSDVDYRAPNLLQRVVSLFKNVRPGSDLTSFQNDHDRIHLLVRLIIAGLLPPLLVTMPLALSWKSRTSRFVLFMSRSKAVDVRIQAALGLPERARTRGWWSGDADELRWRVEWRDEGGRKTLRTVYKLSPLFNIPKSHLQCFGESVYCVGNDLLGRCNKGETPHDRFTAVVSWSISTLRPVIFGISPYNPILGETHHVTRGNLNVLLEQVSHHPPVTALHATDEKENLEMIWCQHPTPKFYGTSVETEVHGKRQLKLLNHGETYEMNSPKLLIKFLPLPWVDWVGENRIRCHETGLEAELYYGSNSWIRGNPRTIKGKIFDSTTFELLYEIHGRWDRTVKMKDVSSGKETVIYNANEVISELKTPIVTDLKGVWPSESAAVWGLLSQAIIGKDWGKAREAKKAVEEKHRELLRERESRGETWIPKHFTVTHSKEGCGWDCSPIQQLVPLAPISVPL